MRNLVKMLLVVVLFSNCILAIPPKENRKPIYLAVIVDASDTSQYKWGQIKLYSAKTINALSAKDKLEVYSSKKDLTTLHTSLILDTAISRPDLNCINAIAKHTFGGKADLVKSTEQIFENFKSNCVNFDCMLLIVSSGNLPDSQIRQLRMVLSAYRLRSWPVMFATFDDAKKDIFAAGSNREFTVSIITNNNLKFWIEQNRSKLQKTPISQKVPEKTTDIGVKSLPVVKKETVTKPDIVIEVPVTVEVKRPKQEKFNTSKTSDTTTKPVSQAHSDTVADIQLKSRQEFTAKFNSSKSGSSNTIDDYKKPKTLSDSNSLKIAPNKTKKTNIDIKDVNSGNVIKPVLSDANTVKDSNTASLQVPAKSNQMLITLIPALILAGLVGVYLYKKTHKAQLAALLNDSSNQNTKLMASYNGTEYDLSDITTIGSLEIGSQPASTIPIDCENQNQKLFILKAKGDRFFIKNVSDNVLTVNLIPLAPMKKIRLFMPSEIRYGENVFIHFYQITNEENNKNS